MYENNDYHAIPNSAIALSKTRLDLWYSKYMNIPDANVFTSNTFRSIYGTKLESLIDIYVSYHLCNGLNGTGVSYLYKGDQTTMRSCYFI